MADRPPHPATGDDTGKEHDRGSNARRPSWSKVLGLVLAVLVVLLFIALHIAGVAPH